jgi:hypothetical protein
MSNFGEPALPSFHSESVGTWAICGGNVLLQRSLGSFSAILNRIPASFRPKRLEVIGGKRSQEVAGQVDAVARGTQIPVHYHPEITAERASELLSGCAFGWLDYFGRGTVWPGMIFKSGSFAAFCAHAIVPIMSHDETGLGLGADGLPGPFVIAPNRVHFPPPEDLPGVREQLHSWYHRNASSARVARSYAEVLA